MSLKHKSVSILKVSRALRLDESMSRVLMDGREAGLLVLEILSSRLASVRSLAASAAIRAHIDEEVVTLELLITRAVYLVHLVLGVRVSAFCAATIGSVRLIRLGGEHALLVDHVALEA